MIPNSRTPPGPSNGRVDGERDVSGADVDDELAFLLARAGIVLPPERMAVVAAEYVGFRNEIAMVNGAFIPQDEPALIFVAGSRVARE